MHIALIVSHGPSPHTVGQWRLPRSLRGFDYNRPAYWEHLARTAERGLFDMIFLADAYSLHDVYNQSTENAIRYAVQYPRLDPLPLLPIMARVTTHLGLAVTASTTFLPPYWLARHLSTLDHLTEGRVAWNVVTSYARSEAANFGIDDIPDHDERYERAEEFLELCKKLWGSWESDAVLADRETGVYADPAKVSRTNFSGQYFRSEGPLSVPQSPQGEPFIIQAGSSPRGMAFAANHAELCFAVRHSVDGMKGHCKRLKEASIAAGHEARMPKVLWGVLPIVGETTAEAQAKQRAIQENIEVEAGLTLMSGHFNVDLSVYDANKPLPEIEEVQGIRGQLEMVLEDFEPDATLGEVAKRFASGIAPHIVGTPKEVVDQLEALLEGGGGDGFMIVTHAMPGSVDDFVDLVVPELQRRGLYRTSYSEVKLRDRFN